VTSVGVTSLAPLPLRGTAEHIADRLITAIALGEFVPGQRLPPERELAQMLAVGRASVREALHRLAGAGYVEIVRGRNGGAYVRRSWAPGSAATVRRTLVPNWAQFEQLLDLRSLIEGLIARTAAERHNDADVDPIRDALRAYQIASDREESRAADQALHSAIATATKNPFLANLSGEIRSQVSLGFQAEPYSQQLRETALEQHANLVDAVLERRAADAQQIAADHFALTERALRELLERARAEEPSS
jgi:GntR family transcriptional regulator, transcriptional repressor for pyruvate dehydrogenase complex